MKYKWLPIIEAECNIMVDASLDRLKLEKSWGPHIYTLNIKRVLNCFRIRHELVDAVRDYLEFMGFSAFYLHDIQSFQVRVDLNKVRFNVAQSRKLVEIINDLEANNA